MSANFKQQQTAVALHGFPEVFCFQPTKLQNLKMFC